MRPRPNSGLRPLAFLRYDRLGAIARVEVAQLRLEIALQARAVLALERPQLLHPTLQRGLALLELRGDRRGALLGLLHGLRRLRTALALHLVGPGLGLGEVLVGLGLRVGEGGMRVGLSLGEQSFGFGLGLREVLIGHARAAAAYRRLLRGLCRLGGLLLSLLGGHLRLL